MTNPTHIIDSAHAMFDDILASVRPPALTLTADQITRARRLKWLLWNSYVAMDMDEDARIEELEQWCIAAAGPELGPKLFEAVFP